MVRKKVKEEDVGPPIPFDQEIKLPYVYQCADQCSHWCCACGCYYDENHSQTTFHRYRRENGYTDPEWWKGPPPEATGEAASSGSGGAAASGGPHPWRIEAAKRERDHLRESLQIKETEISSGRNVPPWAQLHREFGQGFCCACGNWIDQSHLNTNKHQTKVLYGPDHWTHKMPTTTEQQWEETEESARPKKKKKIESQLDPSGNEPWEDWEKLPPPPPPPPMTTKKLPAPRFKNMTGD